MKLIGKYLAGVAAIAALSAGVLIAAESSAPRTAPLGASAPQGSPQKNWTADNGNGTFSNPLFYTEFEDPDPIRVGDTYYLAGTTMHMMPAVQLMQSKDLVNWELAGYCGDKLRFRPGIQPRRRPKHLRQRHLGAVHSLQQWHVLCLHQRQRLWLDRLAVQVYLWTVGIQ